MKITPHHRRKIARLVDGTVRDTLNAHPDYVTRKGRDSLHLSLTKRLTGQMVHLVKGEGRASRPTRPRVAHYGARAIMAAIWFTMTATAAFADTIKLFPHDGDSGSMSIRFTIDGITSFDTPEIRFRHGAECDLEIKRGKAAKARLRALIKSADLVEVFPMLDERGAIRRDAFGRGIARVIADGENIGITLEREGHGMRYLWETETIDWCAQPPARKLK